MSIRVLVVDDEGLVRAGFRALVDAADGLEAVGEAADGMQAVRMARATAPDVVLMDLAMPRMDGVEATRLILDSVRSARIVVVTTFDDDAHVFAAIRAGASGFVHKDIRPEHLLDAIRVVAAGDALLSPAITRRLVAEFARTPDPATPTAGPAVDTLTAREREVWVLVAGGRSNGEIAAELVVGVPTVKTHVSRLLAKLDVRDRAQLVVAAYESGTVTPGG